MASRVLTSQGKDVPPMPVFSLHEHSPTCTLWCSWPSLESVERGDVYDKDGYAATREKAAIDANGGWVVKTQWTAQEIDGKYARWWVGGSRVKGAKPPWVKPVAPIPPPPVSPPPTPPPVAGKKRKRDEPAKASPPPPHVIKHYAFHIWHKAGSGQCEHPVMVWDGGAEYIATCGSDEEDVFARRIPINLMDIDLYGVIQGPTWAWSDARDVFVETKRRTMWRVLDEPAPDPMPRGRGRSRANPSVDEWLDAALGGSKYREAAKKLGLKWPCTSDELKVAWRAAASRLHPDKGGSEAAFKAASNAHDDLKRALGE